MQEPVPACAYPQGMTREQPLCQHGGMEGAPERFLRGGSGQHWSGSGSRNSSLISPTEPKGAALPNPPLPPQGSPAGAVSAWLKERREAPYFISAINVSS